MKIGEGGAAKDGPGLLISDINWLTKFLVDG
jgi:hypothetical protein